MAERDDSPVNLDLDNDSDVPIENRIAAQILATSNATNQGSVSNFAASSDQQDVREEDRAAAKLDGTSTLSGPERLSR